MKTKFFAAAIAALGFTANSYGQADTATASSSIHIVTPISISKEVDLNFGNVIPGITGGSAAVPAVSGTPTRAFLGDAYTPNGHDGTVTAAQFDVTGEVDYAYTIALPGDADVVMLNGANEIEVTTFTCSITPLSGGVLTAGAQTFYVGAKALIDQGQVAGNYTADFDVSVVYN